MNDNAPFWSLGFRPFFWAGAIVSCVYIASWSFQFFLGKFSSNYFNPTQWHAHEMIFGFAAAVIAGFLLTASQNWSGLKGVSGRPLKLLLGLWFLGRLVPFLSFLNVWLVAIVEISFLVLLMFYLKPYLFKTGQERNRKIFYLLALLFIASGLVHYGVILENNNISQKGLYLGTDIIICFLLLISGRVLPFFKSKALMIKAPEPQPNADRALVLTLALYIASGVFSIEIIRSFAAIFTSLLLLQKWLRLKPLDSIKVPILAILFLSYFWIIIGFVLVALNHYANFPISWALHCFMVGGLGGFSLGMLTRVSLGHTGRKIHASPSILFSYLLIILALIFRVGMPWAIPSQYSLWILMAGLSWSLAFVLFLYKFSFILFQPRYDT